MDGLTHTKQLLNLLCIVYTIKYQNDYSFGSKPSNAHTNHIRNRPTFRVVIE